MRKGVFFITLWFTATLMAATAVLAQKANAAETITEDYAVYSSTISLGETETYTFTANEGDSIVLSMAEAVIGSSFSPNLALYGPDGDEIGVKNDFDHSAIWHHAERSGTYTVLCYGYASTSGDYNLYYAKIPGANELGELSNDSMSSGSIDLGEIDTYTFSANAGDYIVLSMVEAVTGSSFSPNLVLYGPDGDEIDVKNDFDHSAIWHHAERSGTYTVVCYGYASTSGDYSLYYAKMQGANELGELSSGNTRNETIDLGDIDTYTFPAHIGDTISLKMVETIAGSSFSPYLVLFGPDGDLIVQQNNFVEAKIDYITEQSGTYTVLCYGYSSTTGDYTLYYTKVEGTDPCTVTISPTSLTVDEYGGTQTVTITASDTTCPWTASETLSWATLTKDSGTGTSSLVVTVHQNIGEERYEIASIAGHKFHIVQEASTQDCSFNISPQNNTFPSSGGNQTVNIDTFGDNCTWAVHSPLPWLNFDKDSGTGDGSIVLTANKNTGDARNGMISIAGYGYIVNQEEDCSYSISPTSKTFSSGGGSQIIAITANSSSCEWTASESLDWVTLNTTSGTGSDSVTVTVEASDGEARSGNISIAGKSFAITQQGCTYSISPTSKTFSPDGGSQTVAVTANGSSCEWTASESLDWVTLGVTSGTGSDSVTVTVETSDGEARSGNISIAGKSFAIFQEDGASELNILLVLPAILNASQQ